MHPAGFIREGRLVRVNLASLVFQSMGSTIVDKVKKLSIFAGFIQRFSKFHGFYGAFDIVPYLLEGDRWSNCCKDQLNPDSHL